METLKDRGSSPLSEVGSEVALQEDQGQSRRQSGRVRRKPEIFSSQTFNSSRPKRKRQSEGHDNEDDASNDESDQAQQEDEVDEDEQDDESEESEGEADDEELRARRQSKKRDSSSRKQQNKKSKAKPAAKKQKIMNGISTELALRPIMNGQKPKPPSRKKKPRMRQSELGDEEGLYGAYALLNIFSTRWYR